MAIRSINELLTAVDQRTPDGLGRRAAVSTMWTYDSSDPDDAGQLGAMHPRTYAPRPPPHRSRRPASPPVIHGCVIDPYTAIVQAGLRARPDI